MLARQDYLTGPLQVQAQMQAMQEQMQRPEVQEQMKEAQALMQDKGFAEKVEKLKVSWLAWHTSSACALTSASCLAEQQSLANGMHMVAYFQNSNRKYATTISPPDESYMALRKFHFPCCYLLTGRSRAGAFL